MFAVVVVDADLPVILVGRGAGATSGQRGTFRRIDLPDRDGTSGHKGGIMPIYGVDIHPRYQAGISIEQIRREGFEFMAVKVSEGTDSSFMGAGSADFLRRGRAVGLLCMGYHYLRAGNEDAQARVFAAQLRAAGMPGMLDAEDGAGDISNIRAFVDGCRRHGAPLPLMYLPRWYWDRIGRPDLRGLPPLWASRYVSGDSRPASAMYERHNPAGWDPYGGLPVAVLQFTSRAAVAGREIDANAFQGTREQFAALIGGASTLEDDMATPAEVWSYVLPDPFQGAKPKSAADLLGWAAAHAAYARGEAAGARAAIAELTRQVAAADIDEDALIDRMQEAVRTAMAEVVHVDVDVQVRDSAPQVTAA
jgi:hypothetical protein